MSSKENNDSEKDEAIRDLIFELQKRITLLYFNYKLTSDYPTIAEFKRIVSEKLLMPIITIIDDKYEDHIESIRKTNGLPVAK